MEHKFCEFCGKKLVSRFVFDHYDKRSGERVYTKQIQCPSRKWWNVFFFLHDSHFVNNGSYGDALAYYHEGWVKNLLDMEELERQNE